MQMCLCVHLYYQFQITFVFFVRAYDRSYPTNALSISWHKRTENVTKAKVHLAQIKNKELNHLFQISIWVCISPVLYNHLENIFCSLSEIGYQMPTQNSIIGFKISLKIQFLNIMFTKWQRDRWMANMETYTSIYLVM